ncbi:MAG: glutamate-cysteine ligase family protein [Methanopyri archaeon]|nr:glutamate-cysteine ligase family protein [Methanopyri archaeon]
MNPGKQESEEHEAEVHSYDNIRRVGGELESFIIEKRDGEYVPAPITDKIFTDGPLIDIENVGTLAREFHRDMIEFNPDPCISLHEHYARLKTMFWEAELLVKKVRPNAELVGLALNQIKPDPALDTTIDDGEYSRKYVYPSSRYYSFIDYYKQLGDKAVREFLSMGLMVSYQAEFSVLKEELAHLYHLRRNLVPLMVAICSNSPTLNYPDLVLDGRITLYRRNFSHGHQHIGIPTYIPEDFNDYLGTLEGQPLIFDAKDARAKLSVDYRWVRLNVPTSVIVEPREIDSQPSILEDMAPQAAQFGLIEENRDNPVIDSVMKATPEMLEKSLTSAAKSGLEGEFFTSSGSRPIYEIWGELLEIAAVNLEERGFGEQMFLKPFERRIKQVKTPAQVFIEMTQKRGLTKAIDRFVECMKTDKPLI